MLFKQAHLDGIKAGTVTLAFRKWKKLSAKEGSRIQTSVGLVEIGTVTEISGEHITHEDARKAGFHHLEELQELLLSVKEGSVYKIELRYHSADPRLKLREQTDLTGAQLEAIADKLRRLDKFSKTGPWTTQVLEAIEKYPHLRAADLADRTGREKEWLKLNVRKLKNLGLTVSHHPGYTVSPLGEVVLGHLKK